MSGAAATGGFFSRRRPIVRLHRQHGGGASPIISEHPRNEQKPYHPMRRIGLLGGSFNPAHEGHRAISLEALRRLDLDQVWWLVSPQNPLKSEAGMADFAIRMAWASDVVAGHPKIQVMDLERRFGTQYTVDTVRRLKRDGNSHFVWLIGADNLLQLPAWRNWQNLLNLVPIAVFDREPYSYQALAGRVARAYARQRIVLERAAALVGADPPAWVYFRLRRHRISSTWIRSRQGWPTSNGAGSTSMWSGTTEGASS